MRRTIRCAGAGSCCTSGRSSSWAGKVREKGLTVVPLQMFVDGNWIRLEIALVRGKLMHDKRDALRKRTMDREAEQEAHRRG